MRIQTLFEEKLNTLTHVIGSLLGIVALILLINHQNNTSSWSLFSVLVYGISIIVLFTASACYHAIKKESLKHYFRILDHISIYLLIAGTYTPVLLITLEESFGWMLFWVVWGMAFFGIILKLFFTGRFEVFSVGLYILMGWLVIFDFSALTNNLEPKGIWLLVSGGFAYTFGIVFYAIEKIRFNHVIWHIFVLAGAICHFFMVFFYVI